MGDFNEILVGRFARVLQRLTGIKGEPPTPQLGGDLLAALVLEMDRPEWAYLGGESLYSVFQNQAGVAAVSGRAKLRNPKGSGVLAIVEGFFVWSSSGGQEGRIYRGITDDVDLAGATQGVAIDGRGGNPLRSACIASVDTNAAAFGTGVAAEDFPYDSTAGRELVLTVRRPNRMPLAILPPGISCGFFSVIVNTPIVPTWFWRERVIEPSENLPN